MRRKPKAYRREKRKEQVILQLRIWKENGYATEATSYKLAGALDMRPSQHFTDILNEMVEAGTLKAEEREQPGRYPTKFYSLVVTGLITEKYKRRRVAVRRQGVTVGSLELWT